MSKSRKESTGTLDLKGHLLLAMPGMQDERFARSVVLICSHSHEGSMGLIINQPVASPKFSEILNELNIEQEVDADAFKPEEITVFRGGPVEQGRGFVLHSLDYGIPASTRIGDLACLTATIDALRTLASPNRPKDAIMLLGYSGWGEGQLEEEIAQNGWLTLPATREIIFETHHTKQYVSALAQMGISEELLSASSGHA